MDQLSGSPVCCAGGSGSASAEGSPWRWAPTCRLPAAASSQGTKFSPWAPGHWAGPLPSRGRMRVSASLRMGSSSPFCKDTRRRRINFHLLWFSTRIAFNLVGS